MAPVYTDKKTNRLYIEFQYRGHRHKERLPEGTTKESAVQTETRRRAALKRPKPGSEGLVYFMSADRGESFKIGFTVRDPQKRLSAIQSARGSRLELLATRPGTRALEQSLLFHFRHARKLGEWFWSNNIHQDLYRFENWTEEIGKLDREMWLDERLDRTRSRLVKRYRSFVKPQIEE